VVAVAEQLVPHQMTVMEAVALVVWYITLHIQYLQELLILLM
jgi:hypothetical protein